MIDLVIKAFAEIGLLARPLLSLSKPDSLQDIRVGEAEWSCKLSLTYHPSKNAINDGIGADLIWIEVKEGPMEGKSFRLAELLNAGQFGVWQLLGGRSLRNNLLADVRSYKDLCHESELPPPQQFELQDIDDALKNGSLKGIIHDAGNDESDWRIFDTAEEIAAANAEDAIVFGFRDGEDTLPFYIPNLNPDANDALMSEQQALA